MLEKPFILTYIMDTTNKTLNNEPTIENNEVGNQSTTNVVSDTIGEKFEFPLHKQLDADLIKPQIITPIQDIKAFLARPILLRSGSWTVSTTGTFIAVDLPYEALHNTMYTPKVEGFLNFRATAVVTLQVNANRFVQGRLVMHYIPQAQVAGTMPNNRNLNLTLITQQPRVELDANTECECTLKIPYISPKLYYDLNTGDGQMGALYVSVYSALAYGVGGTPADYSLWIHFEDVELEIPVAPTNFLTQSGRITGKRKKKSGENVTDAENPQGPVSEMSKTIGDVAGTIRNFNIPVISDIAGTVSWVADAVGSVASFFGFSNPRSESMMQPYKYSIYNHAQNCDMGNHAEMLAFTGSNKLETLSGLGPTDLDESSFAYIMSKPAYFSNRVWATTDVSDTIMLEQTISKSAFMTPAIITDGTSSWNVGYYTPVAFFMNYFKYWRGSIKLTFKFVKTEFHTGRLVFSYLPHPNTTVPAGLTIADTNYLLREIVDIRDSNEVSFIIPYTHNNPWIDGDDDIGTFYVHVLNPLVAPDAASTSVTMLMEVSAGPDFDVSGFEPRTDQYNTPILYNNSPFVSQMGSLPTETKLNKRDNVIGNAQLPNGNFGPNKYVMGEKLVSVYNVIKRFSPCSLYGIAASQYYSFNPFEIGAMGKGQAAAAFSVATLTADPLSLFSSFYAYSRGSTQTRLVYIGSTQYISYTAALKAKLNNSTLHQTSFSENNQTSLVYQNNQTDAGINIAAPPYQELHARLNRLNTADKTNYATYAPPNDEYSNDYEIGVYSSTSISGVRVFRAASDDYQLGFFLGIPPLFRGAVA